MLSSTATTRLLFTAATPDHPGRAAIAPALRDGFGRRHVQSSLAAKPGISLRA
jgi:hypothetical protein